MEKVLTDFVKALRNSNVRVSPAETLDAMSVIDEVGYDAETDTWDHDAYWECQPEAYRNSNVQILGIFAFAAFKAQPALSNVIYGLNSIEYGNKIINNLFILIFCKIDLNINYLFLPSLLRLNK